MTLREATDALYAAAIAAQDAVSENDPDAARDEATNAVLAALDVHQIASIAAARSESLAGYPGSPAIGRPLVERR